MEPRYPNKAVTNQNIQKYHFAGTGVHAPMTIEAGSPEEAQEKYHERIGVTVKSSYETDTPVEL